MLLLWGFCLIFIFFGRVGVGGSLLLLLLSYNMQDTCTYM